MTRLPSLPLAALAGEQLRDDASARRVQASHPVVRAPLSVNGVAYNYAHATISIGGRVVFDTREP